MRCVYSIIGLFSWLFVQDFIFKFIIFLFLEVWSHRFIYSLWILLLNIIYNHFRVLDVLWGGDLRFWFILGRIVWLFGGFNLFTYSWTGRLRIFKIFNFYYFYFWRLNISSINGLGLRIHWNFFLLTFFSFNEFRRNINWLMDNVFIILFNTWFFNLFFLIVINFNKTSS